MAISAATRAKRQARDLRRDFFEITCCIDWSAFLFSLGWKLELHFFQPILTASLKFFLAGDPSIVSSDIPNSGAWTISTQFRKKKRKIAWPDLPSK
jgi:hypothetical protein